METKQTNAKVSEKSNLIAQLNTMNKSANVSRTIKDKYIYPVEFATLKSTDKEKKSYRKKIQKTILFYLQEKNVNTENKTEFEKFLKTFVSNFVSLEKSEINDLYSFHDEKEKEQSKKVLSTYQNLK